MTSEFHILRVCGFCNHISCVKLGEYVVRSRGTLWGTYCHEHALARKEELHRIFPSMLQRDTP